jgi:hypothetical protein
MTPFKLHSELLVEWKAFNEECKKNEKPTLTYNEYVALVQLLTAIKALPV